MGVKAKILACLFAVLAIIPEIVLNQPQYAFSITECSTSAIKDIPKTSFFPPFICLDLLPVKSYVIASTGQATVCENKTPRQPSLHIKQP